jgi:tRNA A-37 threonylcarbamoyl transferase component Bud32/cytochrome c-type biogenesis protein CcmH/NrfG
MTLTIGENVGPYRIIAQLGQGGMATVYKAYHASLDRYVAIKVMHAAFKEDPTFLGRFQREARVLAKLEHPNIVPVYDFADHQGQPYLVMKYVEGDTLKARMADGSLSTDEILKVVDAVGAGLAYAHKQGVLHRDIKPSNVIITPDGQYYLSDFGLARIATAGESTLSQDTMLGTPNYISPEQAKGVSDLDGRTDIYSFGVLLYEMIVGRVPYSGDTPFAVIHDHIYTPLPLPSAVNPNVPEPVERVLLKALAKERDDRFADASALVAAFHQALEEAGTAPQPAPVAPAAPRSASSTATRRAPTAAATVVAPPVAAKPASPPAQKKSGFPWAWLVVGGIVLVALALGAVLIGGRILRTRNARATSTALAAITVQPPTQLPPSTPLPPPTHAPPADRVAEAEKLVADNPGDIGAHLNLGQVYYEEKRIDDAAREFQAAAELSKFDPKVYEDIFQRPFVRDDPVFLLNVLLPGLEQNRESKELAGLAGPQLDRSAPLDHAEPTLLTYVATFPNQVAPKAALAQYYILHGQPVKARKLVEEVRRDAPDAPVTHMLSGEVLAAEGKPEEAIAEFQKVMNDPNAPEFLRRRAENRINHLKGTPAP